MTSPWTRLVPLVLCFAIVAGCGDDAQQDPTPVAEEEETYASPAPIGGKVPDFTLDDTDGNAFQMSALDADRASIEKALRAAGEPHGLKADMGLDTKWADLPGLQEDGEFDPWAKWRLLSKVGGAYGRVATEESVEQIATVGDAVDWIERLNGTPIVFMTWSPRCKTCPQMNERMLETFAAADARLYAVASSYGDKNEMFSKYRELYEFDLRILPDMDAQTMTNYMDADRTPTFVVFDGERRLVYRGALDDDPMGMEDLADRKGYVLEAVKAAAEGKMPAQTETKAPG